MTGKLLLACATIGSLAMSVSAAAAELQFSYFQAASDDGPLLAFSFDLSSDPTPQDYAIPTYPYTDPNGNPYDPSFQTQGYVTIATTNFVGNFSDPGTIIFYSSVPILELYEYSDFFIVADGGFTPIENEYITAPQFYTGLESAPHFSIGTTTFDLGDNDGSVPGSGVVTISALAVPEPSTWAMLLAGMGAIGTVMRRRTTVSYAFA